MRIAVVGATGITRSAVLTIRLLPVRETGWRH